LEKALFLRQGFGGGLEKADLKQKFEGRQPGKSPVLPYMLKACMEEEPPENKN